ncbi:MULTISPECIES: nucleotide exchange factor GrpE [unclassified Ruminococcus]|uniref:nucleotide exchange factor GrpE n=1 Tax=unclassified Ruminococcus TaxID=2608920 RepID=UPI00210CDFC7|nr:MULTISPECIES: nucleotide exchange factor GrpE [unclassified Ruminococcus]MCQ4021917.1 nucleotide exchange factor GrpE [Ruminococcus sp. zg-924]MCQ4115653.1 nucleotide exchange factor GrpE [Ruminococcus sp. zg-921]
MAEIEKEEATTEQETAQEEAKEEKNAKKEKKEKKDKKADKAEKALEEAKKELEAQKNSYLRLAAEYDNYRKRTTNEKAGIYSDATAKAVAEILTVADSLEMAVKAVENAPEEFKKGIELVAAQMQSALAKLNVEKFAEVGEQFNPQLHNAVSKVDDESLGENVIAQVFQSGYKTGDKIIRHAMVQVANCD